MFPRRAPESDALTRLRNSELDLLNSLTKFSIALFVDAVSLVTLTVAAPEVALARFSVTPEIMSSF